VLIKNFGAELVWNNLEEQFKTMLDRLCAKRHEWKRISTTAWMLSMRRSGTP